MNNNIVNNYPHSYPNIYVNPRIKNIDKSSKSPESLHDLENTNEYEQQSFIKNNLSPKNKKFHPWERENKLLNVKKISDGYESLRQTFDVKKSSKFVHAYSEQDTNNEESAKSSSIALAKLRNTTNILPIYSENFNNRLTLATTEESFDGTVSCKSTRERPLSPRIDLNEERGKVEQYESSSRNNSINEEIRKLKEDRRKRLEGTSKEERKSSYGYEHGESFKKKNNVEYHSPKYEKNGVVSNLESEGLCSIKNEFLIENKSKTDTKIGNNNEKEFQFYNRKRLSFNIIGNDQINEKIERFEKTERNQRNERIMEQNNISRSPPVPLRIRERTNSHFINITSSPLVEKTNNNTIHASIQANNVFNNFNNNNKVNVFRLEDFEIGESLGEGKFGTVNRVTHKPTGSIFALKKVPKEKIKTHNMIDQFTLELKLQTFLTHKNILKIYKYFDDRQNIYLLLEYMEQGTLYNLLKKKKTLPEEEVAQKIKQISLAIKYLHENEIAHRDIKPENIVISNDVCKIADFGWATICKNRRKTCCGTFDYTPPEIFEGEEYDYTVDLWCLGILTYELLVGKAPFYHYRREETKNRIVNVENTVINYPEHLSKNAIDFIENLLKKDPKDRLSSEELVKHKFLNKVEEEF